MSEPEIARRCVSCGASVRKHAIFCPECGNPLGQGTATATAEPPSLADTIVETAAPAPPEPIPHDGVRGRVQKLRRVSSVVIDQAAYDPSLRFLLVAAALFLLFLVLLILSKVLG